MKKIKLFILFTVLVCATKAWAWSGSGTSGTFDGNRETITLTLAVNNSEWGSIEAQSLVYANDFETGDVPDGWTNDASYPWTIVQKDGSYCLKSGNAGVASSSSTLQATYTFASNGAISFRCKISSESGYDKGYFKVDGSDKINGISGDGQWTDYTFEVTEGTHTFEWRYKKDSSVDRNDDVFYIDDIVITENCPGITTSIQGAPGDKFLLIAVPANEACDFVNWTSNNVEVSTNPKYMITLTASMELTANFQKDFDGAGTAADPFLISSTNDWNHLAEKVNAGNSYSGKHFRLTEDITVSEMVGTSEQHKFSGTFDGDGHTLTFNITAPDHICAPFRYIHGATIKFLIVDGTITGGEYKALAGIAGWTTGTNSITNCWVKATMTSSFSGDSSIGGFVSEIHGGTISFTNCLFSGSFVCPNAKCLSGFAGWTNNSCTGNYTNCLVSLSSASFNNDDCATFSRLYNSSGTVNLNNSYYGNNRFVTNQGLNGTSMSNDDLLTALGGGWEINSNKVVPVMGAHSFTGAGTELSPYLITSTTDWNKLAFNVNNLGDSYNGKYFLLANDITVTTMVGTDACRFSGNFNGNGHKLTLNLTASENNCAPFRYINGATIKFLVVDGTITGGSYRQSAGIAGMAFGTNTITSCWVKATMASSFSGDSSISGLVMQIENGTTSFTNCLFTGSFDCPSATSLGGFVGWTAEQGTGNYTNCLSSPSSVNITNSGCKTFARLSSTGRANFSNSYYPTAFGDAQGTQSSNTGSDLQEQLGDGWVAIGDNVVPKMNTTFTLQHYNTDADGWYLISSPMAGEVNPTSVTNMTANTYDLFRFNQSAEQEWQNYKAHHNAAQNPFNALVCGQGYLYANSADVTLTFIGAPYSGDGSVTLEYSTTNPDSRMHGWNLIGNPFGTTATINKDFYRMNDAHTEIIPADENNIEPMEGIFVRATGSGQSVTFSTGGSKGGDNNFDNLVINLSRPSTGSRTGSTSTIIDRAIVSFDENRTLPKFQIDENNTKLYIPQDGKDYAIAFSDRAGELPLNFAAKEMGTYTITVETQNFASLQGVKLIDKLENAVIDLNVENSYTFIGSIADNKDRFVIKFESSDFSDNSEIFAYQNGTDIVVNGEGELHVFDVMGRMIMQKHVNGVETIAKPTQTGIYILKLNGMTQKIVTR